MKRFTVIQMLFVSAVFVLTASISTAMPKESGTSSTGSKTTKQADSGHGSTQLLTGKVIETMNSGGYSYILLENNGKKTWVAVTQMQVKVGQQMSFEPGAEMVNFESKTLNRRFDRIIFTSPAGQSKGSAGSSGSSGMGAGHGTVPAAKKEEIKVEKASGQNAYTVAEVYKNKKKLNKKTIVVKGKVVKFSAGIMEKNWIHLQDGTGDAQKGTHNLVATTTETAAVGDIITVTATLAVDKDLGSGYKYSVLAENAKISK